MKEEILLTISILVSGRPETRRCLDSLNTLREKLPCELILTDTGCPEEMKEWLKEYTDQIYSFDWCNDFAAARNVGLKHARGRWFIYMDDDEWFEDTSCIIDFFQSGDYNNYKAALYKVRNYGDWMGLNYKDSYVSRMSVMSDDIRFEFPIHEVLLPGEGPAKYLEDYVHHFGYVYDKEDEERQKHERNLPLLLAAHKKDKHCLRHNAQLILEYFSMGEHEKALKYAYEGMKDYDQSFPMNDKMLNVCYASVANSLNNLGRYRDAWQEAERLVQEDNISALAVGYICGEAVYSGLMLREYERGLIYLKQYFLLKEAFDSDRDCYLDQQTVVLESCFDEERYRWILVNGAALAAGNGDGDKLEEILRREPAPWWEDALTRWCLRQPEKSLKEFRESLVKLDEGKELCPTFLWLKITGNIMAGDSLKDMKLEDLRAFINEYADKCIHYYKKIYAPAVLLRSRYLLTGEFHMAELLQEAEKELTEGKFVEALKKLKKAIPMYKTIGKTLNRYAELLAERFKQEQKEKRLNEERNSDKKEFLQLAEQVKVRIRAMLQQKQYNDAREAIDQLRTLLPGDRELSLLEQQLPE